MLTLLQLFIHTLVEVEKLTFSFLHAGALQFDLLLLGTEQGLFVDWHVAVEDHPHNLSLVEGAEFFHQRALTVLELCALNVVCQQGCQSDTWCANLQDT